MLQQEIQAPSNLSINMSRDAVIRCLMVYLGESPDQLLKEYDHADEDSVSQDLAVQRMRIYTIKTNTSEGPDDIGIMVEGTLLGLEAVPKSEQPQEQVTSF